MADEPANITLEHLKAIRAENDKTHRMLFDMLQRLGSLEQKMGIVVTDIARVDARLDGFDKRLDRIEKRLNLVEA
jgi:hypothetical protein